LAFIPGPDPTYSVIYDGSWTDDNTYYVIHRIAVAKEGQGIARQILDWAFGKASTIRIDTHRDNVIMHHVLQKYGFKKCGVIFLLNGDARDAYHLTKNNPLCQ
jgi:RimJ/RimL family protein N-acetyltransferase